MDLKALPFMLISTFVHMYTVMISYRIPYMYGA